MTSVDPQDFYMSLSELREYEPHPDGDSTVMPSEGSSSAYDIDAEAHQLAEFMDGHDVLEELGRGSFGVVYKIRNKATGEIYARKDVNWQGFKDRACDQLSEEVRLLQHISHPSIVRCHEAFCDSINKYAYICMEYCGGGSLDQVIERARKATHNPAAGNPKDVLSEIQIWRYVVDLVQALHYCHDPKEDSGRGPILHRDLKAANVFLDEKGNVKIGDFGLSRTIEFGELAGTRCGTPRYMAPEINLKQRYDSAVDIWALGCIIYELCELESPFSGSSRLELRELINAGNMRPMSSSYSDSLKDLVRAMLRVDPTERPQTKQLIRHTRINRISKIVEAERRGSLDPLLKLTSIEAKQISEDEAVLRHRHNKAMSRKSEAAHKLQQQVVTMLSPAAAQNAIANAVQERELHLHEEFNRREQAIQREYKQREIDLQRAQRKLAMDLESKARINKRRVSASGLAGIGAADAEKQHAQLQLRKQELDEREARANQRDFAFCLQVLVRAAKGHAPYPNFVYAMHCLVKARARNYTTYGRCTLDSRDLTVIHRAVLHSKTTGSLQMYHSEAVSMWFLLLPEHQHVPLEAQQIWDEDIFPSMEGISDDPELESLRFPEEDAP